MATADEPAPSRRSLRENDERFRILVEQVTEYAIFLLDTTGHIISWNAGAERLKGYKAEEITGQHFSRFYRPVDLWKCDHELNVALREGRVEDEGIRVRKDGTVFWANVVITALRDETGTHVGFAKVTRDLTERRRAEETLRESEERFRLLVESVKDYAIFMLDPSGVVTTWNIGAERINGYRADEILGHHFSRFYPEVDVRAGKCEMELERAAADGRFEDEGWRLRKDGTPFWANVVITRLKDATGRLVGFAKVTRDLTERRRAEEERARLGELARERIARLSALSEALAGALSIEDVARAVIANSLAFAKADTCTFYQLEEPTKTLDLVAQHGLAPELVARLAKVTDASNPAYAIGIGDAGPVWIETFSDYQAFYPELANASASGPRVRAFWCVPLVAEGRTFGLLAAGYHEERSFTLDEREFIVTFARQCAQATARARRLSAERSAAALADRLRASLSTTLRSIGDAVVATDGSGAVTFMNGVAECVTGWSGDQATGRPVREVVELLDPSTRQRIEDPVARVLTSAGAAGAALLRSRDGREVPVEDKGAPIRSEAGGHEGVVFVFRDVTERQREELRRAFLADATARLAATLDHEASLRSVASLAAASVAEWCIVDVREGDALVRLASERAEGTALEPPPSLPDRSELTSHLCVVMLVVRGRALGRMAFGQGPDRRAWTEADRRSFEELARRCANAIDNAALFASEQEARRAADVANRAKDEFLAVVSHELRTPLNAIMGWSKMLTGSAFDEGRRARAMQTIERNAVAMAQLIDDLLDMSRVISGKMRLEMQPVDLGQIVQTTVDTVRPTMEAKRVALSTVFALDIPPMMGDPTRLQQIVWNLLSNAAKFTPEGGHVELRVRGVPSGVEIVVRDTGRGIDRDFLPCVFDAFRQEDASSSRARGGLGLGLAITRQLVELHGGRIAAESEGEGKGATFTVTFPVALAEREAPVSLAPRVGAGFEKPAHLRGLRVLAVDDDDDARQLVALILEGCGCRVRSAASVAEAMEALAAEVPDVLLSDVAMPHEDGYELIRRVRALPRDRGGDLPAGALTAYARPEDRRRLLNAGFSIHLAKPIEPAELVAVVATLGRFAKS